MAKKMQMQGSILGIGFDLEVNEINKASFGIGGWIWNKRVDLVVTGRKGSFDVVGTLLDAAFEMRGSDCEEAEEG